LFGRHLRQKNSEPLSLVFSATTTTDHNNNKMNAAEVCEVMERAPEDMSQAHVDFFFTTGEACCTLWHREMDSRWRTKCRDPLVDVELWRRFGLAVRHSKFYILQSRMCSWLDEGLVERGNALLPAGAQCVDAFWSEAKHNNFVHIADLDLTRETLDHLGEFIQNNEKLSILMLRSSELDLLQQCTESLSGHQHLFLLQFVQADFSVPMQDALDKLLCDATTFESISASNHVLEKIELSPNPFRPHPMPLSRMAKECLELNKDLNKTQVICNKIFRFYFVGEFDVSPFSNMVVSVLPEVVSQIESTDELSAIYRLLRHIPELCNVSER
jgi:hypothetical protein